MSFILSILLGCASSQITSINDNPLENYVAAKKHAENNESIGEYSLEYQKSQAAMYLLSQGKTDLKSGNSIRAVQRFAQARNLNPWNDEIKDFYTLSVNTLVKVTKHLSNENCDVINDRLGFIYSVAQDQLTELKDLTRKCNFKVGASSIEEFHLLPLSEGGQQIEKSEFESLIEEIDTKIKKNQYVPRKELLYLGLNYLSNFKIITGKPSVGSEVDDSNKVRILIPISSTYNGPLKSVEYCEQARKLLQNKEYEEQIGDTPVNRVKGPGYLECRHFYGVVKKMTFYSSPKWPEKIRNIWPLPKDFVMDFIFYYQNGQTKKYRNIVSTLALPDQIEYGIGLKFMYTEGELPFVLRYSKDPHSEKRYMMRGKDDFIEFELPSHQLNGLTNLEIKMNLQETFRDSYDENNKIRGKYGPGGIIFDQ